MIRNLFKNRKFRNRRPHVPVVDNAGADEATIYVYEEIWRYGINAKDFVAELNDIDAGTIHLRINSPGGDVFAARAMQTALRQKNATIIAHIDGLAASAATTLALGADQIEMVEGGFFMIHNAATFIDVFGYFMSRDIHALIIDLGKENDLLEKVDLVIAGDYAKKTGEDIDTVLAWMNEETWFTAQEALDANLIDNIYEGQPVENDFDLSVFGNAPAQLFKRPKEQQPATPMIDTAALLRRLELEVEL